MIGVMMQSAVGKSAVFLHGLGFSYASGVLEEECCFLESRVAISCLCIATTCAMVRSVAKKV